MSDVIEIDASTGEVIERDFTPEEIAQYNADQAVAEAAEQARLEARAKREAALDKLAALGLTRDDLTALSL